MKFLHIGDLHLGRTLGEFDLQEDQKYILDQIFHIAQERGVDAVLIAGDVYDKSVPAERAVLLLDEFLKKLSGAGIKVFLISGNHDSDERLGFGSSFFETHGVYINTVYNGEIYRRSFTDEYGEVNIWLLPFVKASAVKAVFPNEEIADYDQAFRVIMNHAKVDGLQRNVLVAHQFVAGSGEEIRMAGSENAAVQNVGLVDQIGADCFDDFDYVALGHIHSAQRAGREEVRYCGSPLKYSVKETHSEKSVTLVTLKEKDNADIELIPLKPLRDLRHLKGGLKQILNKANITNPEDFVYVTLTDETIINDSMNIIRQYYPNTVKLDYENSHTRELESADFAVVDEEKSFTELFSDFYRQMYGCEPGEAERKMMEEAAQDAGIA